MKPDRASSEEPPPESPPRSAGELRQTILELQRARDELVGKTAFFEAKVHSSPDGILVVDGEGRRILQNQRNIELWNVPKEIADDPLDERQLVWGTAQTKNPKVFAAGVAYLYAHPTETGRDEIELKDGRILDRYSSPVLGHDGRNYGRIWTFRDVTAQVRAARQLEENRALLDGVLRNSVDGVIACQAVRDAQGNLEDFRVLLVNPAAERLLGRRLQDLVGRGLLEASPDIILDGLFEAFARIVETGKTLDFEYSAVRADALRWYRIAGVKLGDGLVLNYSDITARKRQEQNLNLQYAVSDVLARASTVEEARAQILQTLGEQLGWDAAGFWMADARAGLLRCDEVWSRHGLDVGEFLTVSRQMTFRPGVGLPGRVWSGGQSAWVYDVVRDTNFPRSQVAARAGLHGGFAFPLIMGSEVGAVIDLFSREPRQPDDGLLHLVAGLSQQIGQFFQRRRLEEQLFQSRKMETVGKLAGGIAHEFNSLMTAIIGQSEMLLDDLPRDNALSKNAREIREAADRAAVLTRQLLAYGRKQILQPEALDLNAILAGMEGMFRHLMGGDVDVRIVPGAGLKPVYADAGQVEQVMINMAMNARDAMPRGGKLTLETANVTLDEEKAGLYPDLKPGDYVMLAISDTGTGIAAGVKEHVFEPFFSTKEVGQGTGLGLATCYGIVKQSGGHISLYSEKDRGTTFKIYLPQVSQDGSPRNPARVSEALPRGTETLLLVEDDPALRRMAATLLGRLGYTVLPAADGAEALALFDRHGGAVDLLFTDVIMPHLGGKDLADRVSEKRPEMKVLFTSAYTENAIIHQGVLNPGVALLQKPFAPSALARKVREILDAR